MAGSRPDIGKPQPDASRFLDVWNHQGWHRYMRNLLPRFQHVRFVGYPSLKDVQNTRIEQLYVPLGLAPRHVTGDQAETVERSDIHELLKEHGRLIVLGDPGSGKSTLIAHLTTRLAAQRTGRLIPLPFTLRDYHIGKETSFDDLLDQFCRQRFWPESLTRDDLIEVLKSGQALILFDGLDEIGSVAVRTQLRNVFWRVCTDLFPSCQWVLTSRIVGYDAVRFDSFSTSELFGLDDKRFSESVDQLPPDLRRMIPREQDVATAVYLVPFSDAQIDQFGRNWFEEREPDQIEAQSAAAAFSEAIRKHATTHRLARTPNLLTMMALIYRVRTRLPNGRTLLYDEITEAYLQTIQEQRQLELPPAPLDSMRAWLGYVAFQMQLRRQSIDNDEAGREILVDHAQVQEWIVAAMREGGSSADESLAERFVDYLARRSGLLLPRGLDDEGRPQFAFMHLSFQEYFAAHHIRDVITAPRWLTKKDGRRPPRNRHELTAWADNDRWRETLFYLAEMLASQTEWPDELAAILFGDELERLDDSASATSDARAELAATLAVDPYSGLTDEIRTRLIDQCCGWEVSRQSWHRSPVVAAALLSADDDQLPDVWSRLTARVRKAGLQGLNLDQTSVSDLSPLSKLSGLEAFSLAQTSVWDLRPLSGLSSLQGLVLHQTSVSDLSPLSGLSSLRGLYLDETPVSDLSPLSGLSSLEWLTVSQTSVSDLSPLSGLSSLQLLAVSQTSVLDLSPLSGLSRLEQLFLGETSVSDLSPLSGLSRLEQLFLDETSVSDLSPLSGLSCLEVLYLHQTSVSDAEIETLRSERERAGLPPIKIER